jgi:hypothetical protein
MEDFRHISRLADIHGRQHPEQEPHRLPGLQINPRRILLSLTVILGMIAWWAQ